MPKVSVVMITYNMGQYIADAIQSVLNQNYHDFEIIVLDDGSTDNTREVVSPFPVKYFRQDNQGVCQAYNRGTDLSSGEYIIFLDADDVMLEDILAKEVEVLDNHPEVAFCYPQVYIMKENEHIYRVRKSTFLNGSGVVDGKEQIKELLFNTRITSSATMIRRQCLDEVGRFDERFGPISEDRHLYIKLCKRYPLFYIAEPLLKYRVHHTQTHKMLTWNLAETAFHLILQEVFDDPNIAPQFERYRRPTYSFFYHRIGNYAYGHDMRIARDYFMKAFKMYPQVMFQKRGLRLISKYAASLLSNRAWRLVDNMKTRLWDSWHPFEYE